MRRQICSLYRRLPDGIDDYRRMPLGLRSAGFESQPHLLGDQIGKYFVAQGLQVAWRYHMAVYQWKGIYDGVEFANDESGGGNDTVSSGSDTGTK
jgi:hypothetical protein